MINEERKLIKRKEDIISNFGNFINNKLYIKDNYIKTPVVINLLDDNSLRVFLPLSYKSSSRLILYCMSSSYIELELRLLKKLNPFSYIAEPVSMLVSSNRRYYDRYDVIGDMVSADGFRLIDREFLLNPYNLPLSVKNMLNAYELSLKELYPNTRVSTYSYDNPDKLIEIMCMCKKIIYIEDINNIDSYFVYRDGVLNKALCIDDKDFLKIKAGLRDEGISSLLLYPLLVSISNRDNKENLAYIKIALDKDADLFSIATHLNVVSYEIDSKLKGATMRKYTTRQKVVDLSMGGVKLYVDNPKLTHYFSRRTEVSFNISFEIDDKDLVALRFHSRLIYKQNVEDASYMGFVFKRSMVKGFDRLESFLKLLGTRMN